MPTMWRSISPMICCAWSLSANAGVRAVTAFAPDLRQPFGRLDRFGPADDRGEVAVEHLEVHAVLRHGIGREERLELVEFGVGQGFVERAEVGHGGFREGARVGTRMYPRRRGSQRNRGACSGAQRVSAARERR